MAKKVVAFEIDIKGTPSTVKALKELNAQVGELAKSIQEANDPAEIAKLQKEYVGLKANIKALNEEQTKQIRDFKAAAEGGEASLAQVKNRIADIKKQYENLSEAERQTELGKNLLNEQVRLQAQVSKVSEEVRKQARDFRASSETGEGSYKQLSNRLTDLRKQFQNLSKADREGAVGKALVADIKVLDKELKGLDASVGSFQRNVGNYPKVVKAFIRGSIPGFEQFQSTLEGVGISAGRLNTILSAGFGLFQVASLLIRAGQAFSEFTKEVDAARASVASLTGLTGQALDDATARSQAISKQFGKDIKDVTEAALTLSKELGIGYDEALDQIEKGFVAGLDANGDFLEGIKDNAKALQNLGEATDDFSVRQRRALESQKELSRAQVELAKRFADSGNQFEVVGNLIQAALIQTFLDFLDLIQPLINIGKQLFDSFRRIGESLGFLDKEGEKAQGSLSGVNKIMEFQIAILTAVVGIFAALVSGIADFIQQTPILRTAADGISKVFSTVIDVITNIPSALAGAFAAIKQFFANVFDTGADADMVQGQMANLRAQGLSEEEVRNEIARQAQSGRSVADAFGEAYRASVELNNKKTEVVVEDGTKRVQVVTEEAAQKQADTLKKIAEERVKFQEELRQRELRNVGLILELQRRLTDATIAAIESETERTIEAEREASRRREQDIQRDFEARKAEATKREAELTAIFGRNSKEVQAFREQVAGELFNIEVLQNKLIEQERQNSQDRIAQIEAQAFQNQLAEEKRKAEEVRKAIEAQQQARIGVLENGVKAEVEALKFLELQIEEQRARGIVNAEEAAKQSVQARIDAIKSQINLVNDAEKRANEAALAGLEVSDSEIAAILTRRQELNTELAKLEEAQTAKVISESQKQADARRKQFEDAGRLTLQGVQVFDQFLDGLAARETARVDNALQSIAKTREQLGAQLQTATGLEREFLEARLQDQAANAEKLAEQQEAIKQREARRNKKLALLQATINTALAVSSALAVPPGPPITIPNAILAGALGAAQVAAIAAAPAFAKGGKVGKGNIPRQANGDNVLATVKTGEVVLNQGQQAALGGASTFARIGVPGFATGGRIGAPIVAGFDPLAFALQSQREQKVVLIPEDLYRDEQDRDRVTEIRQLL